MDYRKMTAKGIVLHMLAYGVITKDQAAMYFPKLDEGKDERIKACIEICLIDIDEQKFVNFDTSLKECIDWLNEKVDNTNKVESKDYSSVDPHFFKPANKVEPNFREGDWVVYNNDICQIVKREEGCNKLVTKFGIEKELVNERNLSTARLWTIQDARNGDVLVSYNGNPFIFNGELNDLSIGGYCGFDIRGNFVVIKDIKECNWTSNKDIKPATKEQCNELFKAMAGAGYEWDAKKKELRKIERNNWKPNNEQLKALDWQVNNTDKESWQHKASKELLEQLKKLTDEQTNTNTNNGVCSSQFSK